MAFSIHVLSEINQRKTNTVSSLLHVESQKKNKNKQKQLKLTDTENRLMIAKGGAEG